MTNIVPIVMSLIGFALVIPTIIFMDYNDTIVVSIDGGVIVTVGVAMSVSSVLLTCFKE